MHKFNKNEESQICFQFPNHGDFTFATTNAGLMGPPGERHKFHIYGKIVDSLGIL